MSEFCYVYVLLSPRDGNFYTGFTHDLKRRLAEHQPGEVPSTAGRRPLELAYYEACRSRAYAMRREVYLKSTWGKRYLRVRLQDYLTG
jgi:putative endonuclease